MVRRLVGVPARAVKPKVFGNEPAYCELFSPYGTDHGGMIDPVQKAMDSLFSEIDYLKKRVKELENQDSNIVETADNWSLRK